MGPWAHGGWSRGDGDKLGALAFGAKTERRVPRALRAAVLRAPPARRAARGRAGSGGLRDRRERVADAAGVAARRGHARARSISRTAGRSRTRRPVAAEARSEGAGAKAEAKADEYVSDPEPAGAVRAEPGHRHAPRLHDRGSALRRDAAGRARLPDAAARRRPDRRRPHPRLAARLDDRHRRRLGGQGDRRVSRGRHGAGGRVRRAARRLSAAGARRAVPRQVPRQLRAAGAVRPRASRRRSRSICRTSRTRSAAATG